MEKRAHVRQPADFEVVISGANIKEQLCRVKDFCLGGMLVGWQDRDVARNPNLTTLIRNDAITINIDIPEQLVTSRKHYQINANIARIHGNGIGLAFRHPDSGALASIQQLARISVQQQHKPRADGANNTPHFNSQDRTLARSKYSEHQERQILNDALDILEDFLDESMKRYVKVLDEKLRDALENARDNAEQNALFDAINQYRKYDQSSVDQIRKKAAQAFRDYAQQLQFDLGFLKKDSGTNKIGLIDKEEFEDWLVVKVMATKIETSNNESLMELQHRFHELSGIKPGLQNNPVAPMVICYAFNDTMSKLPLTLKLRKIIYATFEKEVAQELGKLYEKLNHFLAQAGVLPDFDIVEHLAKITPKAAPEKALPQKTSKETPEQTAEQATNGKGESQTKIPSNPGNTASTGAAQTHTQAAHHPGPAIPILNDVSSLNNKTPAGDQALRAQLQVPEASGSRTIQQFEIQNRIAQNAAETVKQLIANHKQKSASIFQLDQQANDNAPVIEAAVFNKQLNNLQTNTGDDATDTLSERVHQNIQEEVGDFQLGEKENAALKVTERLFESILELPAVNDTIRPWVKKLEIPFYKLLIKNDAFLQDTEHPARKVLNTVTKLGKSGVSNNPQSVALISNSLQKLVDEFDQDISVFNSTNHELEGLLQRQEKLYKKNVERVQEHAKGQFRIKNAKRFVDSTLESIIAGEQVPKALLTLLDAGWRELLNLTVLRFGSDSDVWKEYEGVMHDLIQAANPHKAKPELPKLLRSIKSGLNAVSPSGEFNDERTISELRTLLTAERDENAVYAPMVNVPAGSFDSSTLAQDESKEDVWYRRARRLSIGTWLEVDANAEIFENDDVDEDRTAQNVQMRLAWVDKDADDYVFVNHQGMKIVDLPLSTLANLLRNGLARLIDDQDQPIVNLGLDRMVHTFYEQLVHHAAHDELTGLLNRREFERQVKIALAESRQQGIEHTLACIELPELDAISNSQGMDAVDHLLKEIASFLKSNTPKNTIIAHLTDHRFSILLKAANEKSAGIILTHLSNKLKKLDIRWQEQIFKQSYAIGINQIKADSESVNALIKDTLLACKQAKADGNTHHQHSGKASLKDNNVEAWEKRLNEAIANNRLHLRCQKIRALTDNSLPDQYEILLSMRDEQGKEVDTSDFIHAAECFGKMQLIDRWVIKNVLHWMQEATDKTKALGACSINLSSDSLNDEELLYYIFENLVEYEHVPRAKVCFEVTESTAVNNVDDLADFVQEMKNIGCHFSLDDFGSESSSYGFLKNLPLNYVKIDGSFIRKLSTNEQDYAMVKSINDMVHFMGKKTIAKQVEDQATIDKLKEIGVDFIQGYGVEAPIALEQLSF